MFFIAVLAIVLIVGMFFLTMHVFIDRPAWAWIRIARVLRQKVIVVEGNTGSVEFGREMVTPFGKRLFISFNSYREPVALSEKVTNEYSPRRWEYYE